MKALIVGCDIHIDNVSILKRPLIRNAMTDHLQNESRHAHGTRDRALLLECRVVAPFVPEDHDARQSSGGSREGLLPH